MQSVSVSLQSTPHRLNSLISRLYNMTVRCGRRPAGAVCTRKRLKPSGREEPDLKIKVSVSEERYDEVASELTSAGIELDEDADLLLTEREKHLRYLAARPAGRETDPSEKEHIPVDNIISIEAFGHNLEIRTTAGLFRQNDSSTLPASSGSATRRS